jgi:hypothetical protein
VSAIDDPDAPVRRRWAVMAASAAVVVAGAGALVVPVARDGPRIASAAVVPTLPSIPAGPDPTTVPPTVPATTVAEPTTTVGAPGVPANACTYTDPMHAPIPVERARRCPDGTRVWVFGVIVEDADGTPWFCSERSRDDIGTCRETGLRLDGIVAPDATMLSATKDGDALLRPTAGPEWVTRDTVFG